MTISINRTVASVSRNGNSPGSQQSLGVITLQRDNKFYDP